ncbi:uncharacterized protein LOC136771912 [Amia ocellicauda]|uniref:uncharacterized protein LOC136771912 n=1 Tax=Amia ocellicauda TaxID=2972642 RepID=UPI003463F307
MSHGARLLVSLLLLLVQRESLCEAAEQRTVRAGDTVTLDCGVRHQRETLWFGQRGEETPFLGIIVSIKSGTDEVSCHFFQGSDPRLSAALKSSTHSISLRIHNITEADLALYYCAERAGGGFILGNGTKLVDGHVSGAPAPCVLSWALLGCVSAGCLLLSGCLCCLWSRRGGVQCVGRSEGAVQANDVWSVYANAEMHTDPNCTLTRRAAEERSVYVLQGGPEPEF